MRPLGLAIVLAVCSAPFLGSATKLTGGTGSIYVGSYARRMVVIDEATERVTAEIPLVTGIPWSARPSQDGTRFYIQNADLEHFEILDIATRKTIDTFTLSEGNKKVRIRSIEPDPHAPVRGDGHGVGDQADRPVRDRRADARPIRPEGPQDRPHDPVADRSRAPILFPDAILTGRQAAVRVFRGGLDSRRDEPGTACDLGSRRSRTSRRSGASIWDRSTTPTTIRPGSARSSR